MLSLAVLKLPAKNDRDFEINAEFYVKSVLCPATAALQREKSFWE